MTRRIPARRVLPVAVLLAVLWWLGPRFTPLPDALVGEPARPGFVTDRHGVVLYHALHPVEEVRTAPPIEPGDIPPHLSAAVRAAEDKRFLRHGGVDYLATIRAIFQAIRHRELISGASTLTQQVVKLRLHRGEPRTLGRKLREIWLARALEARLSKGEILSAWLNEADFGSLHRGARQAAAGYFGKPVADLSLGELSLLAALPQSPERFNPRENPQRAVERRNRVLDRLAATGWVDQEIIRRAIDEPLGLSGQPPPFSAPHFVDWVRQRHPGPGVRRTTLDAALQTHAAQRLAHHLGRLEDKDVTQGAVVVLENATGAVRVMVGSVDIAEPAGQVNHALRARSPGSALKPFTYLLAFSRGDGPWSLLADVPGAFATPTGPYEPENFHRSHAGPVTARFALANSLNIPAVRLLARHGGPIALHGVLEQVGIHLHGRSAVEYGLGLTLGNAGVRPLDLAAAYACLARGGRPVEPRFLAHTPPSDPQPVFDEAAVWLVGDILRDNRARAAEFGLRSPLAFPWPVAAKTGTSTDFRDNWTVGFTDQFTVAVWVGNSDNRPMRGVSGIDGAAPVFHDVMLRLHRDTPPTAPPPPSSVIRVTIDPASGCRVADHHPRARHEWASHQFLPPLQRSTADGRIPLGRAYARWLERASPEAQRLYILAPGPDAPLRIIFPLPGTELVLDPALPDEGRHLVVETDALPGTALHWSSPTLEVRPDGPRAVATLQPGRHEITAAHPTMGREATTWVRVRRR